MSRLKERVCYFYVLSAFYVPTDPFLVFILRSQPLLEGHLFIETFTLEANVLITQIAFLDRESTDIALQRLLYTPYPYIT